MPFLSRKPEAPYTVGLLLVLGLIMLVAVVRSLPFFVHQVFGVH